MTKYDAIISAKKSKKRNIIVRSVKNESYTAKQNFVNKKKIASV